MQVIDLYVDVSVGQLVGHPGPLSERDTDVLVHHGDATLFRDLVSGLHELALGLGLFPAAEAVVVGVELGRLLLEFLVDCVHKELLVNHSYHSFTFQGWKPASVLSLWILSP